MQKIVLTAAHLKAIALLAADQDIRYYLNGVLIEATPFETRCIATDGCKLGVARFAVENDVVGDTSFIIPSEALEALKVAKRDFDMLVSIEIDGGAYALRLGASPTTVTFKPIDGRFPDWRRVIPKTTTGAAAVFRPDLMTSLAKCGQLLTKAAQPPMPRIDLNGNGAARITFDGCNDFCGVAMPYEFGPKTKPADVSWAV